MTKKDAFILEAVSGIDDDIISRTLARRQELWNNKRNRKKNTWIPILAAAASFFILLSSVFLFLEYLGSPVYLGMTVTNEAVNKGAGYNDGISAVALSAGDDTLVPMLLANDGTDSREDTVSGNCIGDNYYAMPGDDIYIYVHIENPEGFEILSFTLNGVKYSSYMFEDGSDLETLILKCNVGEDVGVKQYTIDSIKYVDGKTIKNVRMEGERTIDVVVGSSVSSVNFEINTLYGSTVLTPVMGEGVDSRPEILSIEVYHGEEKIMDGDPNELTINGLPLGSRLLVMITYIYEGEEECFKCVFDTPKVSEGLETSLDGYIVGIGSCKDTTLYLDKPVAKGAFSGDNHIKSVYLGEGVSFVAGEAFYGCNNLEHIFVSDHVRSISGTAFLKCSSLERITVDDDNKFYHSEQNCLIDNETDALILGCKSSKIPTTVKSIASGAFLGCTELTDISIPRGVTSIGKDAFKECTSLADVYVSDSVEAIGDYAFYGCKGLRNVTLSEGVSYIGSYAFYGCESLGGINIPSGVSNIGEYAFYGCKALTDVTVGEGVSTIGEFAFYGCERLKNVSLPEGLTTIEMSAFYNCKSLTDITIPEGVKTIGGSAFIGCEKLKNVTLPEGLKTISASAFYGCDKILSIVIPNGVETIGASAFYKCTGLTILSLPETLEYIGDSAFFGCESLREVTIPKGVKTIDRSAFCVCSNLSSLTISSSVKKIDAYAFYFCRDLSAVVFEGTLTEWENIQRDTDWNLWAAATEIRCSDGTVAIG